LDQKNNNITLNRQLALRNLTLQKTNGTTAENKDIEVACNKIQILAATN
jgi:hypothetical protein